jgi:hypothetical protein
VIDNRAPDHGVLELASHELCLAVCGRVGEHRAAEQRQDEHSPPESSHQVHRAADAAPQRGVGVFGPERPVQRAGAAHRQAGPRGLDERAAAGRQLEFRELGEFRVSACRHPSQRAKP